MPCYCAESETQHSSQLEYCTRLYLHFDIAEAIDLAQPLVSECSMMAIFIAGLRALAGYQTPAIPSAESLRTVSSDQPVLHHIVQLHHTAIHHYMHGQRRRAIQSWLEILSEAPADLLALKFLTTACFYIGDTDTMCEACMATVDFVPNNDRHHIWSMFAFALVEKGNAEMAEKFANRALRQCFHSAWALHALCHILLEQGRIEEGMELLSGNDKEWRRHDGLACHIYWHWAIFSLHSDEIADALCLYDQEIFPRVVQSGGFPMDLSDAVSLLIRFEMHNINVSERWSLLNQAIVCDPAQLLSYPFTALHYFVLSFRISSKGIQYSSIEFEQEQSEMLVRLYSGLQAYLQNRFDIAFDHLSSVCSHLRFIGGSNAQRDLFVMIAIQAAMRCQREHLVRRLVTNRIPISIQKRIKAASSSRLTVKLDRQQSPI